MSVAAPHGLVLAAGLSRRMGAFKPLLEIAGDTVLAWAIGALRDGGVDDVTVVVGHRAAELEPEVARLGAVAVPNPDYEQGMYTSLRAGVAALPRACGAFLLLPCDMPAVGPATVRRLVAAHAVGEDPAAIVPTHQGRRGHPPLISARLFPEILGEEPEQGLRTILRRHGDEIVTLEVDAPGVLLDLDRREDVPRIEALLRGAPAQP